MDIITRMQAMRDVKYATFTAKLVPGIEAEKFIGVRTPQLRALAREMQKSGDATPFMSKLPHNYFDENLLHSILLSLSRKSINETLADVERFLPYVDNWAVCDQLRPKIFAKHKPEVHEAAARWLKSPHQYTRRYGIVAYMTYLLDDAFDATMLHDVASVRCLEYYVSMAVAWYFSFALVKQWESALSFLEQRRLPHEVHNRTIQKAVESLRINNEQKEYLRSLRWR